MRFGKYYLYSWHWSYFIHSSSYSHRDPIFEPFEGEGKTYAEMSKEHKNKISHRGRSFAKFKAFLQEKQVDWTLVESWTNSKINHLGSISNKFKSGLCCFNLCSLIEGFSVCSHVRSSPCNHKLGLYKWKTFLNLFSHVRYCRHCLETLRDCFHSLFCRMMQGCTGHCSSFSLCCDVLLAARFLCGCQSFWLLHIGVERRLGVLSSKTAKAD